MFGGSVRYGCTVWQDGGGDSGLIVWNYIGVLVMGNCLKVTQVVSTIVRFV